MLHIQSGSKSTGRTVTHAEAGDLCILLHHTLHILPHSLHVSHGGGGEGGWNPSRGCRPVLQPGLNCVLRTREEEESPLSAPATEASVSYQRAVCSSLSLYLSRLHRAPCGRQPHGDITVCLLPMSGVHHHHHRHHQEQKGTFLKNFLRGAQSLITVARRNNWVYFHFLLVKFCFCQRTSWLRFGKGFSESVKRRPSFSSLPPTRNCLWSSRRNGESGHVCCKQAPMCC